MQTSNLDEAKPEIRLSLIFRTECITHPVCRAEDNAAYSAASLTECVVTVRACATPPSSVSFVRSCHVSQSGSGGRRPGRQAATQRCATCTAAASRPRPAPLSPALPPLPAPLMRAALPLCEAAPPPTTALALAVGRRRLALRPSVLRPPLPRHAARVLSFDFWWKR